MNVGMWMTRNLVTIESHARIADATAPIAQNGIRRLPVVDNSRLVGIVTAVDILRAFPPDVNPFAIHVPGRHRTIGTIGEIMNRNLLSTTPEAPIEEVARIMQDKKIGALPVVRQDQLVGLITESDIFRAFVSLFQAMRGGLRITFEITQSEDVFATMAQLVTGKAVRIVSLNSTDHDNRRVCTVQVAGAAVD